ncbi:TetR/AcrR family transcriptional regulator [Lutibacter sp. A80]|uniref:TetR/AcrR family transcriptional regulator n=1 Tax=Lutibacter sp. A80 TaxID=2918453 RepID=UPI001F070AE4|nr:TetR/AcrR family transcriptional regulator [Lutibacter sp. A80]UMB59280.1 TetR/AcrR family transcriptional regulator [Lutibacter sp. A80]
MPRVKSYNEQEVLEKAMNLFWKNGYETTSMQQLEKEMGINKFSIYASFGSKNGILIESLRCYNKKLQKLVSKMKKASGVAAIKQYFYDFVDFSSEKTIFKGCLITNTANEFIGSVDNLVKKMLTDYTIDVRNAFVLKLKEEEALDHVQIEQKADYLIIAMFGFSSATRIFNEEQLENYIQNIFKNI